MLPLHTVTDCNTLHETVIKSGLPEDRRAAIEVLSIREMLENKDGDSDSEVEEGTLRLKERNLDDVLHWCVSEDQRGDALTKKTSRLERAEWHDRVNWISIRSEKKGDALKRLMIPSRPRPPLDKGTARLILNMRDEAAKRAGF